MSISIQKKQSEHYPPPRVKRYHSRGRERPFGSRDIFVAIYPSHSLHIPSDISRIAGHRFSEDDQNLGDLFCE